MTTIKDLAAHLGLSPATVSRALNDYPYVDETTRARVRAAASAMSYQANPLARALRSNQSRFIGLVVPDILNGFYARGAAVIQEVLEREGYELTLHVSNDQPETDQRILLGLIRQRVAGIVHVPCTAEGAAVVSGADYNLPLVEINRHSEGGIFSSVVVDDRDGAVQVTRHLIATGHRRIAMITGPRTFSTTRDRVLGFREGFARANLLPDDDAVRYGSYTLEWGHEAAMDLLGAPRLDRPSAVFASSSQIVLGVLQAAAELGLRIPDDFSLVGIGDPDWYSVIQPPITTYVLPLTQMGSLAAQMLLERVTNPEMQPNPPTIVRLSGALTVRSSTRPL